ncbi:fungal-specific transcription factor domain-containing protein, partial [Schizophyllum commune]
MDLSSEDEFDRVGPVPGSKKRRLPRACDNCRKRKSDSSQTETGKCTSCATLGVECEHTLPVKKRGPQKKRTYVDDLEDKVKQLEEIIHRLNPDVDLAEELANMPVPPSGPTSKPAPETRPTSESSFPALGGASPPSDSTADEDEDWEERNQTALSDKLNQLNIGMADHGGFMGQSSAFMLMRSALSFKETLLGKATPGSFDAHIRRARFWQLEPWELDRLEGDDRVDFDFPEPDLLNHLVDQYLTRAHCVVPIVHRPTFLRNLREGLHHRDRGFACAILAICAVASRYSQDPRVLLEGGDRLSAGWRWFSQIQRLPSPNLFRLATLHEVQCYAICVTYLVGTSTPQAAWNLMGMAIRMCVQLGIHRKTGQPRSVESESWKRVFWSLIAMDSTVSSFVGRPCALSRDDIDCEYPVECDDEYWDTGDPETSWKQPEGKPSFATCSVFNLRLLEILTFALKHLYCTARSRISMGHVGPEWEKKIAAQLDAAMNKWIDELPEHLRWDPLTKDNVQFFQASLLYCTYYHVQIQIHRPFIIKSSPLTFPSLAICSNAARSCARLLEVQVKRQQVLPMPQLNVSAFIAGVVLLMNLWAGPKTGLVLDPPRELKDVEACMNYLRACENFLHIAGRFHDLLSELASLRDGPFPEFPTAGPSAARKRSRVDYEQPPERRSSLPTSQPTSAAQGSSSTQPAASSSRARPSQSTPIPSAPDVSSRRADSGLQSDWQESFLDPHPYQQMGGGSQLGGGQSYTPQGLFSQGSSRGSFVPSDNEFARMTYIQEELAYDTGFQYPPNPTPQAAL